MSATAPRVNAKNAPLVGDEYRDDAGTDNVLLGASRSGELGVFLIPNQGHVCGDER